MAEVLRAAAAHDPAIPLPPGKLSAAGSVLAIYFSLLKPRVVGLILFTAVAAAIAAARGPISVPALGFICLTTFLCGGGAAALNHWFDRDLDARMARTQSRPIPSGRLARPIDALALGCALIAAGVGLAFARNPVMGACLLAGAVSYVGVYTLWLKRRTPLAAVIGGSAGSSAVLAGWAAVDPALGPGAWLLALLVFVWTPAHFWSLALAIEPEYRKAGVPMLPVVADPATTKAWIAVHVVATLVVSAALVPLGGFGFPYAAGAGLAALFFARRTIGVFGVPGRAPREAFDLFKHSGIYLGIVFLAVLLDGLVGKAAL